MNPTKMIFSTVICCILFQFSGRCQWVTHHDPMFMTAIPQPGAGQAYTDPKTGVLVTRISDAAGTGHPGIFPYYSKRQAWNADQSHMLLFDDDGYTLLFDGITYQFIKVVDGVTGKDIFWHPDNPDVLYFNPDSILYACHVPTGEIMAIHDFSPYNFANTEGEGNLSDNGRFYAVAGQYYNYTTGEVIFNEIIVYDIQEDQVVSSMEIPQDSIWGFDWVSVSRKGQYVVVDYADTETGRYHGIEVYDRWLNFIWQKPLGAGHSDLGIDSNGEEILVMDIYDDETNETVYMKYRLSDGLETELLRTSLLFDQHISLRNEMRRQWCFISTFDYVDRLTDDSLSWLPFEDEVFALRLDGSGDVQRIAHHHSRRYSPETPNGDESEYWSEPHATVDRDGKRVLWGSNWRIDMANVESVDTYLADFSDIGGMDETRETGLKMYPNPAGDQLNLEIPGHNETCSIRITDMTGRDMIRYETSDCARLPLTGLKPGLYLVRVQTDAGMYSGKILKK